MNYICRMKSTEMDILFEFQENLLRPVKNDFRRYLHKEINWNERMVAVKGPRGAGKTTLLLQYLKFDLGLPESALYITADHTWFYNHTLLDTCLLYTSYEIEDKYGNPDWALIDEYEIILSNPTDEIVLSLLTESTEAIELPTGEFNISASNKENTVRAGIKADSPTGSYVEIKTSVEATLYLVRGTVTITEEGGEYTIVVDAESALGSTVKAKWTGSITIADKS